MVKASALKDISGGKAVQSRASVRMAQVKVLLTLPSVLFQEWLCTGPTLWDLGYLRASPF